MANQYRIMTDNCTLGVVGATISDSDTAGYNIAALVDGGHLELVTVKVTKSESDTKGN